MKESNYTISLTILNIQSIFVHFLLQLYTQSNVTITLKPVNTNVKSITFY